MEHQTILRGLLLLVSSAIQISLLIALIREVRRAHDSKTDISITRTLTYSISLVLILIIQFKPELALHPYKYFDYAMESFVRDLLGK